MRERLKELKWEGLPSAKERINEGIACRNKVSYLKYTMHMWASNIANIREGISKGGQKQTKAIVNHGTGGWATKATTRTTTWMAAMKVRRGATRSKVTWWGVRASKARNMKRKMMRRWQQSEGGWQSGDKDNYKSVEGQVSEDNHQGNGEVDK